MIPQFITIKDRYGLHHTLNLNHLVRITPVYTTDRHASGLRRLLGYQVHMTDLTPKDSCDAIEITDEACVVLQSALESL